MIQHILIVMDAHLNASGALAAGMALARAHDAGVVCCVLLPRERVLLGDAPDGPLSAQGMPVDAVRDLAERLLRQTQDAAGRFGVPARSVVARDDDSLHGILQAARAGRCDVIVVACDGGNAAYRLLSGSLIPALVTASPVPVMVCSPSPASASDGPALRRLLVLLEGSELARVALAQGVALAQAVAAEVRFVHIAPPELLPVVDAAGIAGVMHDRLAAAIRLQSHRLLASAVAAAEQAGVKACGTILPSGTTARKIVHAAIDQDCDMIVAAHRGGNAVTRLLTGSLIPGLITAATMPVFICRESGPAPGRRSLRGHRPRQRVTVAAGAVDDRKH